MSEGNSRTGTTSGTDPDATTIRPADDGDQTVIRNKDDFYRRPNGEAKADTNGTGGEQLTLAQRVMRGQTVGGDATTEKPSDAASTKADPANTPGTASAAARSEPSSAETESVKQEPAEQEPAKPQSTKTESTKPESTKTVATGEPTETEQGKTEPTAKQAAVASGARRTRKARLRLARIDPWSVMKTAFLFSIAGGIVLLVAVYVIWGVIGSSGLFEAVDQMVQDVIATPGDTTPFRVQDYVNTDRVMGVTALLAFVDVVIFTALATLGSFLYNLAATMLGGLEVTLAED